MLFDKLKIRDKRFGTGSLFRPCASIRAKTVFLKSGDIILVFLEVA